MSTPLYLDGQGVTTRHLQSIYPWQCQPGLPSAGPVVGVDVLAGNARFCYDPFALYERRVITSPSIAIMGKVGKGKSSQTKTMLHRQLLFGRQAFALDPKQEYAAFAEHHRIPLVRLVPGGGGAVINPLDPGPLGAGDPRALHQRQTSMLVALSATVLGRDLRAEERVGLSAALGAARERRAGAIPLLRDIAELAVSPNAALAQRMKRDRATAGEELRDVAMALVSFTEGDLLGMFDGPTSVSIDWDGPGLVLDLSSVYGTEALAPVMVAAGTWLAQAISRPGPKRFLVLDEVWAILRLASVTRWLQSTVKLARSYGVSVVIVMHRLSDLAAQSAAGSEAERQAKGLLADVETKIVYAQDPSERQALTDLIGLSTGEVDLVTRLAPYRALWCVGRHRSVVAHVLSPGERILVDTDAAMSERIA